MEINGYTLVGMAIALVISAASSVWFVFSLFSDRFVRAAVAMFVALLCALSATVGLLLGFDPYSILDALT